MSLSTPEDSGECSRGGVGWGGNNGTYVYDPMECGYDPVNK